MTKEEHKNLTQYYNGQNKKPKRHSDILSTALSYIIYLGELISDCRYSGRAKQPFYIEIPSLCFMINVLKVLCILPRVHINYRLPKAITLQHPLLRLQAALPRILFRVRVQLHCQTQSCFFKKITLTLTLSGLIHLKILLDCFVLHSATQNNKLNINKHTLQYHKTLTR